MTNQALKNVGKYTFGIKYYNIIKLYKNIIFFAR